MRNHISSTTGSPIKKSERLHCLAEDHHEIELERGVIVSNQAMDTFTALENYRLREKIEELFAVQKGRLDGARPRTWYPDNLRGRQFTQFVSLGYHCFLTKKIKEVQVKLRKKEPGKNKSLIKLDYGASCCSAAGVLMSAQKKMTD